MEQQSIISWSNSNKCGNFALIPFDAFYRILSMLQIAPLYKPTLPPTKKVGTLCDVSMLNTEINSMLKKKIRSYMKISFYKELYYKSFKLRVPKEDDVMTYGQDVYFIIECEFRVGTGRLDNDNKEIYNVIFDKFRLLSLYGRSPHGDEHKSLHTDIVLPTHFPYSCILKEDLDISKEYDCTKGIISCKTLHDYISTDVKDFSLYKLKNELLHNVPQTRRTISGIFFARIIGWKIRVGPLDETTMEYNEKLGIKEEDKKITLLDHVMCSQKDFQVK